MNPPSLPQDRPLQATPTHYRPHPPFEEPTQKAPGTEAALHTKADHGELSYRGCEKLTGKAAIITGSDSGIGRAVAIAYAREGADVLISYLNEHEDAQETAHWVKKAGRRALLVPGDLAEEKHCRKIVEEALHRFGRLDILVNCIAFKKTHRDLTEISAEEWERTFRVNVHGLFYLIKASIPHMHRGGSIINTSALEAEADVESMLAYSVANGAIDRLTVDLAPSLARRSIRINSVAPGPVWTPLVASALPPEKLRHFGGNAPLKRPGQPVEVAPIYVLLASDEASYISGSLIPVGGGLSPRAL